MVASARNYPIYMIMLMLMYVDAIAKIECEKDKTLNLKELGKV